MLIEVAKNQSCNHNKEQLITIMDCGLNSALQLGIRMVDHVIDSYVVHFYYSEELMYK